MEAVDASIRQDLAGASVDAAAALALAGAYGVAPGAAAYLIAQAGRGIAAGMAKGRDGSA